MAEFDLGYVNEPFRTLAANYPDETAYPADDFRTEWGPIFHRGRLDGTARVLLIGQDPGQHENVLRRILVGEAGRRVQGFLAKLGITRSYVFINALLYSVFGSGNAKYIDDVPVRDYRNKWIKGILAPGKVEVVVTFGTMAKKSWEEFVKIEGAPAGVVVRNLMHPTAPESAGGTAAERAAKTKEMLTQWNDALTALHPAVKHPDEATPPALYGDAFKDSDKADIPSFDLPAGIPAWMYDDDGWAKRGLPAPAKTPLEGAKLVHQKRATIVITVPKTILPETE